MAPKLIIPAKSFPVSLEEAKHQLGYFHSEDDQAVQGLIAVATQEAETYTGVHALIKTVKEVLPCFPAGMIGLQAIPFHKLQSIKYYDTNNQPQTLAESEYRVYDHCTYASVEDTNSWPSTYDRQDAVEVVYTVGHAVLLSVNATANQLTYPSHPFQNGDAIVLSTPDEGVLPNELAAATVYYVINSETDGFQISKSTDGDPIEFSASVGDIYAGPNEVPGQMKAAIKMTLSSLNEYKTDQITGTMISNVMMNSRWLLNQIKPRRL